MATDKRLMEWLHDARAIERNAKRMLKAIAKHVESFPEVREQVQHVITETGEQAAVLEAYVEQHSKPVAASQKPANPSEEQTLSGAFVGSEAVKRAMTEISSYNILLAAAESAGDLETAAVCDTIRRQEEAMVEWLRKFLGAATEAHVLGSLAASKRPRRAHN